MNKQIAIMILLSWGFFFSIGIIIGQNYPSVPAMQIEYNKGFRDALFTMKEMIGNNASSDEALQKHYKLYSENKK